MRLNESFLEEKTSECSKHSNELISLVNQCMCMMLKRLHYINIAVKLLFGTVQLEMLLNEHEIFPMNATNSKSRWISGSFNMKSNSFESV